MFYKCTTCNVIFVTKRALKDHQRTHDVDRPFKCKVCDQRFTQASSLEKHNRVHDKMKPFPCRHPGCHHSFSQISNLIRHTRLHTGEKPFKCDFCLKCFASGSNLQQHLQVHQEGGARNKFRCIFDECPKSYLYQSSLKKHYQMSHGADYAQLLESKFINQDGTLAAGVNAESIEDPGHKRIIERGINMSSKLKEVVHQQSTVVFARGRPRHNEARHAEDIAGLAARNPFKVQKVEHLELPSSPFAMFLTRNSNIQE